MILTEENGKTTFTNTILYPSREARDAALKTGMEKGVEQSFNRLEEFLARSASLGTGA
jgi:uncharacterized protein YndB with AHSA1/START domain